VYIGVYGFLPTSYTMTATVELALLGWMKVFCIFVACLWMVGSVVVVTVICWDREKKKPEDAMGPGSGQELELRRALL